VDLNLLFKNLFQIGGAVRVRNFNIRGKDGRSKWTSHDFELSTNGNTEFCDPAGVVDPISFAVTDSADLPAYDVGSFFDIVGLVTKIEELHPSGKFKQICLTDRTGNVRF